MRSGKMNEVMRETLKNLLNELKSPRNALQICNFYKVGYWFRNENDADNFRSLLLFNIGFNGVRVESHATYRRTPGYLIYVTWHESEQEDLIKNIERYLQEDNMGPTNINEENTKFYAIVTDAEGKKTAYEITHSSLTSNLEWSCSGSYVHHTLRFDQEDMKERECLATDYVKLCDEVKNLKAENERLKAEKDALAEHLGRCEDQLRLACEFLNGYDDIHVDIPTELKDLSYFNKAVNYTIEGKIKRREFAKKVADNVMKKAMWRGVWRKSESYEMNKENSKILDDAVESAINPFYISCDTVKADRIDALSYSTLLCRDSRLKLNSVYGLYAENDVKAMQEMFAPRRSKMPWLYEWNSNCETTPHMNVNIYDSIKDVKFANPATIVFWKDGTKTVVKTQGDEEYVPEVGLAMCICKKIMGNTRDYYRVFLHWVKKVKED